MYTPRTLLGNWSEDIELEKTKLRDYLDKKERGETALQTRRAATQEVGLTISTDGLLHVGDYVMMYCEKTAGFLSVDVNEKVEHCRTPSATTSTASGSSRPMSRNVFQLLRAESSVYGDDFPLVCYGDKLRLMCHETLTPRPLFLHSQLVSQASFSKTLRAQEVFMAAKPSWSTAWEIVHSEPNLRFETEGEPVPANVRVVIRHCATGQCLASDKVKYFNSFGEEWETYSRTHLNTHKAEQSQNHWILATATPPGDTTTTSDKLGLTSLATTAVPRPEEPSFHEAPSAQTSAHTSAYAHGSGGGTASNGYNSTYGGGGTSHLAQQQSSQYQQQQSQQIQQPQQSQQPQYAPQSSAYITSSGGGGGGGDYDPEFETALPSAGAGRYGVSVGAGSGGTGGAGGAGGAGGSEANSRAMQGDYGDGGYGGGGGGALPSAGARYGISLDSASVDHFPPPEPGQALDCTSARTRDGRPRSVRFA